jgi:Uma2 family endonuclease
VLPRLKYEHGCHRSHRRLRNPQPKHIEYRSHRKTREYRATPSIQRYVILEQDRIAATVFARAGGDWIGHVFLDGAILAMPEIGIDVPLAEFYDGLVFDEPYEARDGASQTG